MAASLTLLAGCHRAQSPSWSGFTVTNGSPSGPLVLIGRYRSVDECRAALLGNTRAPSATGLACGRECPLPQHGEVTDCAAVVVVRPPQE